ncbi:MAG: class II aldolase/adducin family protein [Vicinamibacterales bacterium]|jgi:L-fuculose-phosphate aldolase|nr:aldolase [Acidobacteriota bacterium]MDP7293745.1 class II aldolase/adducin family protein [Vicinamibacterales bacterium]MDP7472995.1 class II aldolase/adducin family protein [Vicinamibacterales bacterium]MDP7672322.1 class II aldolase/adducin family protein [Vicinamibacterales bacterium]HJO39979.1 class II aldolase/adducin family protein [Vicinamibacterales bacterium]|tara:strand:+ start:2285 stop:3142 length:858 start_codon:yes stop_codon:yes gene_type:complete
MKSQPEEQIRAEIVEVGRRLHERGYVASNDGNISVRLEGDRVLTTPTGVSKGFMTPDMMVTTDMKGTRLAGDRKASSELLMHLAVYEHRPEIKAVVHAHPPAATGFAVAGIPLDRAVLAEVIVTLGSVPIAEYGTPSTSELADAVARYISAHDGLLLANHGALTIAPELFAAYYRMETIEHFARISIMARLLGRERVLSREEVDRLQDLRGSFGIGATAPICADDEAPSDDITCQTVQAPSSPDERLVDDRRTLGLTDEVGKDAEIRLTYRELTALIEDAVKALK